MCVCVCVLSMGWLGWWFFWRGCVFAAACHGPFFHLAVSISIELLPDPVWWDNQRPPFSQTPRDFSSGKSCLPYTSPFFKIPRSSPNRLLKGNKNPHPSITPIAAVNGETCVCGCGCGCVCVLEPTARMIMIMTMMMIIVIVMLIARLVSSRPYLSSGG